MIDVIAGLIEAGRVKVYSVDSYDAASWCDPNLPWRPAPNSTAGSRTGSSTRSSPSSSTTAAARST